MAKQTTYFYDITKIGRDLTGKRDVSIISNEQALLESVKNILNTTPGERVMKPRFGCNIHKYLFEPLDDLTALSIKKEIEDSLNTWETRIDQLVVDVVTNEDENQYEISIYFNMKVINKQQVINFQLKKIR